MTEPQSKSNQACKHKTNIEERKEIMKQFIQAISGKKALYVVIALAAIATVLEIVTSIRNGTNTDWRGMTIYWVAIAGWAACLAGKKKS